MKKAALLMMAAALAFGQTKEPAKAPETAQVYLTSHGKTYHLFRDCMALKRASTVLTATEAQANEHGLKPCGICAHRKRTGSETFEKDNRAWAKEGR